MFGTEVFLRKQALLRVYRFDASLLKDLVILAQTSVSFVKLLLLLIVFIRNVQTLKDCSQYPIEVRFVFVRNPITVL